MYYNVIVKDTITIEFEGNQLVFTFYNIDDAISFAREILIESSYHVEILQFEDKED